MPMKILDLLDQLEEALPDLRDAVGGGEEGEEEPGEDLPPLPDEMPMDEEDMGPPEDEAPDDLEAMPPMLKKKKAPPFPPA